MQKKDSIHIFIGAPSISQRLPLAIDRINSEPNTLEWKKCCFLYEEQYLSQLKDCTQTQEELTAYQLCSRSFPPKESHMSDSHHASETVRKKDLEFHRDISKLVSDTLHCHISPNVSHVQLKLGQPTLGNADADCALGTTFELFYDNVNQPISFKENMDNQLMSRSLEKSTICLTTPDNNHGGSGSKRKKEKLAYFHPPSKNESKSKKTKRSHSLINYRCNGDGWTQHALLTFLKNCTEKNLAYNILAVVLQPCHIKEIQVKSGLKSGSVFPVATVIVLDQSEVSSKVLLWRSAAFWSLTLCPGDVIIMTDLIVIDNKWNGETLLQSTSKSCLKNLGNCFTFLTDKYSDILEYLVLLELTHYIYSKHYYLRDLPPCQPQELNRVKYVRLSQLKPESLVHLILKVTHVIPLKEGTHVNGSQYKIMLFVEDVKSQNCILILWGTSVSWCKQICLKRDHIWEFRFLLSKKNGMSGGVDLHTTPYTSCECLFNDDKKAILFHKHYFENTSTPIILSLHSLVDGRYSSITRIKGRVSMLEFPILGKQSILMSQQTSIANILLSLSLVKYTGCGKCKRELKLDDNNMYEQCLICLPLNQIQTFYRPAIMTVANEDNAIFAHVLSDVLQKIFLNIYPKLLNIYVPGSKNITYGGIVADLCHSLLTETSEFCWFTIESHFSLDDNSMPLVQEYVLLDFHVDIQ